MMTAYKIKIEYRTEESLEGTIEVEAENEDRAIDIAYQMADDGEIEWGRCNDFSPREFKEINILNVDPRDPRTEIA